MPRIDVPELEDLVVRLEWVQMSLSGTSEEEGLISKLDRLYDEGDSATNSGLLPRLEGMYRNSEELLQRLGQFSDLLDSPINDKHAKAIQVAVNQAVSDGAQTIKSELEDADKATQLAVERITSSASQAEMLLRGTRSDLEAIEERMHSVMPQVTQQLKAVIKEAESVLVSNKVRASMEAHVVDVLKNITVSEYSKEIKASWEQSLQNFREEMETTLRQHLEAVEATMVESQQTNVANVKKIVDSRTPSDTIVTLYNELDEAKAKIEKLESSKDKSSHSQPINAKKIDLSNGITVATGVIGAVVGAGCMWLILIGFS